jgi:hypothetical protein
MGKCKEGKKDHHWYVNNLVKNMGWLVWVGEGVSSWTLEEQLKLLLHGDLVFFPTTKQKLMHFGKDPKFMYSIIGCSERFKYNH